MSLFVVKATAYKVGEDPDQWGADVESHQVDARTAKDMMLGLAADAIRLWGEYMDDPPTGLRIEVEPASTSGRQGGPDA